MNHLSRLSACRLPLALALLWAVPALAEPASMPAKSATAKKRPATPAAPAATPAAAAPVTPATPASNAKEPAAAVVGKPAPDFTLADLTGKEVKLSSFKGKVVVLEWFNPGCPFVKRSHTVGSLIDTAKRHTKDGVVWLAINSGGPGKQGAELAMNVEAAKTWALTHPILRDESGSVGKAYGATNTPHMFVIDKKGVLAYAGAIDNSPDGEGQSPEGGKLTNHVDAALANLAAGKPVAVPTTKAYGCSVKYGS